MGAAAQGAPALAAGEPYDGISQRPLTDRSPHLSLGERILLARRLEQVQSRADSSGRLQVQFGYLKELPLDYTGERRIVTVGQLPNGHYQWEERPGAPRCPEEDGECQNLLRVVFVNAKHAIQENAWV